MCVDQHSVFFLLLIDFGFGNVLLRSLYWELRDIEVLARILLVKLWMIHLKLCRSQFSFNLLNRRGCVTVVVLLHGRLFYHFGGIHCIWRHFLTTGKSDLVSHEQRPGMGLNRQRTVLHNQVLLALIMSVKLHLRNLFLDTFLFCDFSCNHSLIFMLIHFYMKYFE